MIVLPEFVVRMAEELDQLEKRMDKMCLFMDGNGFDALSEEKRMLMQIQWNAMSIYRQALKKRLDICAKECNDG